MSMLDRHPIKKNSTMRSLTVILGCLTVAAMCTAQTPNWTQIKPSTSPLGRTRHAMVYDSSRQRTVLFGGFGMSFLPDTWEWDGAAWKRITRRTSPSVRVYPAMAYDSVRQRTVLFGGSFGKTLGDTWEWDGTNWTQRNPTNSPPARSDSAMAYDSVRKRMVLFGGTGKLTRNDTWEWDGTNWKQINPSTSPSPRGHHVMAYDSARQRTVMFGGSPNLLKGTPSMNDTWEWNGTNWKQIKPRTSPSGRAVHCAAYDSAIGRTVLYGGLNTFLNTPMYDTWEYDGKNWKQIQTTNAPSARWNSTMAYDSVRQRTVLFGGVFPTVTWEYGIPTLTLTANTPTISIANGGTQTLTLSAGANLKNKSYWIFGSATSTMPGVVLTGIHIPLVPDIYTTIALGAVNTTVFTKFMGPLSATGKATASLNVPAELPIPIGFKLYHAYVVYDGTTGQIFTSSNPVSVEFK